MEISFDIKKFSHCEQEDSEVLKKLPMLLRRKLSKLDKLALTSILKTYEQGIEEIVFSSQYGEFERLFKLIEQYTSENEVSPIQFSASVHNYLTGLFCLTKKITVPYYALSAGSQSLANGLLYSAISKKEILFCYTDTYKTNECVACIITPKQTNITFTKNISNHNDNFSDFIEFLNGNKKGFRTEIGVFQKND